MTPSEILRKAKALIDTPEKWIQEAYAVNDKGWEVELSNPSACKFCSLGAIHRINDDNDDAHDATFDYLKNAMGTYVDGYNDTHTHAEVMAKWDEAISLAEADERGGV